MCVGALAGKTVERVCGMDEVGKKKVVAQNIFFRKTYKLSDQSVIRTPAVAQNLPLELFQNKI